MRPSLGIRVLSYLLGTLSLRKITLSLLFCIVLLGWVLTPSAEIYRWQDRDGVIRYSNTPPDDTSLILEKIPTQRIPLIEDTNGTVYYLHVPEGASPTITPDQTGREPLTLPPEVVEQLLQEASQPAPAMMNTAAPDLTPLTMRLTELEQSLRQEMTKRQQWEQEYQRTRTYTKELEQQNQTLTLALAEMETKLAAFEQQWQQDTQHTQSYTQKLEQQNDILQLALSEMQSRVERLQHTMSDSKEQLSALQTPPEQFGVIESRVAHLQASVTDMSQRSNQAVDQVLTQVNDLKARQQNALETLYARLENVETDMKTWQNRAVTENTVASLSHKLAELEAQLPQLSTDVKTTYEQDLETFSQKFAMLESKLDSLDVVDQLSTLSSKVNSLETQNAPVAQGVQDVQSKLAALETRFDTLDTSQESQNGLQAKLQTLEAHLGTLQDMIPSSERASEIVEKLLNNGNILKNVVSNQSQQIDAQTTRIQRLEQELVRLRTSLTTMPEREHRILTASTAPALPTMTSEPELTTLLEKQRMMETLIAEQSVTLTMQKERIEALESTLARLGDIEITAEEQAGGRILIVPRKERRTDPEISLLDVLKTSF